jgi:hypothetical protein
LLLEVGDLHIYSFTLKQPVTEHQFSSWPSELTVLEMREQRRYEHRCDWMPDNTKDPKLHIFQGRRTELAFVAVTFLKASSVLSF